MKKCAIIYNPVSGKCKRDKTLKKYFDILCKYGYEVVLYVTEYVGHAKEIVKSLPFVSLVLSIGGDGTFSEVVRGNYERKNKLLIAHLPFGTTNDVGVMYGYPKNNLDKIKCLLDGVIRKVDVYTINDVPFLYVGALGDIPSVSYETTRTMKERLGKLAYYLKAFQKIRKKFEQYQIKYVVDGHEHEEECSIIIISNSTRVSGMNSFGEKIKLNDKKCELTMMKIKCINDMLSIMGSIIKGNSSNDLIITHTASDIKIKFENPCFNNWSIDGECCSTIGQDVNVKYGSKMKMLIPSKNVSKLF